MPRKEAYQLGLELLDKVGLADKAQSYPKDLPGGQKQRVGIARAIAVNPDLLLLDEPTSALDPELVGEVEKVIEQLASEGRTMLVVTHEMALARRISSNVIFMENGPLWSRGPRRSFSTDRNNSVPRNSCVAITARSK